MYFDVVGKQKRFEYLTVLHRALMTTLKNDDDDDDDNNNNNNNNNYYYSKQITRKFRTA
jgi:hypothetical protein